MSYRQQLRRARGQLRRDQGLALLNRKLADAMTAELPGVALGPGSVTFEASTPGNSPAPGVS